MPFLYLDIETYAETDLRRAGPYRYAECPALELLLYAWAVDDDPVQVWDAAADPMPDALRAAIDDPDLIRVAHNAGFERPALRRLIGMDDDPDRWWCTMAQAMTLSLPAGLDLLGEVIGLDGDAAKIKDGKRLVQKFCVPQPDKRKVRRHTRETDPEGWARFVEYARRDVEAMRAIHERLPTWVYRGRELDTWRLDQRINDRGFAVDTDLARAAIAAVDSEQERLADELSALTDGVVTRPSQRDRLKDFIAEHHGYELPDMREPTLAAALTDDAVPEAARRLIEIRHLASKSSTAKYKALIDTVCADGRLRGGLQYYGAARSGRWSGRRFQGQNLIRPTMSPEQIRTAVAAFKAWVADIVEGNVIDAAANALRAVINAPPGQKLVVADLAAIEGRVLAWIAGEQWKLDAYAAYDAGRGDDLYCVIAGQILGIPPGDVPKSQRNQIGKPADLGLGFGGGVGAFQTMAAIYGTQMADYWPALQEALSAGIIAAAQSAWRSRGGASGLDQDTWTASEAVKLMWRDRHPATAQLWADAETAFLRAMQNPGRDYKAGRITFRRFKNWLLAILPSGRPLVYVSPRTVSRKRPDAQYTERCPSCEGEGCEACGGLGGFRVRREIQARIYDSGKWTWVHYYGGKLAENLTQAVARDVMREAMHRAEAAGYRVILTVHDELLTETPDDPAYSAHELERILSAPSDWSEGLPLAAEGYEAKEYRK